MKSIPRFHLAFPVHDLNEARTFYVDILGCNTGRESDTWIDFDLYGHQIVAHLSPGDCSPVVTNPVDKDNIPCRHFGLILDWRKWEKLKNRIKILSCLLYTSPSPRDRSVSRMPSSA